MKVRRIYQQALSPKAVVVIAPFVESCLARRAQKWAEMAKTGEVSKCDNGREQLHNLLPRYGTTRFVHTWDPHIELFLKHSLLYRCVFHNC